MCSAFTEIISPWRMLSVDKWYLSSQEMWMVVTMSYDRSKASRYRLTGEKHRTELCHTEKIDTTAEIAVRLCCKYVQSPFYPAQIRQRGKFSITKMCGSSHVWYAAMIIRPVVGIDRQWTYLSAALARIFLRLPFFCLIIEELERTNTQRAHIRTRSNE